MLNIHSKIKHKRRRKALINFLKQRKLKIIVKIKQKKNEIKYLLLLFLLNHVYML